LIAVSRRVFLRAIRLGLYDPPSVVPYKRLDATSIDTQAGAWLIVLQPTNHCLIDSIARDLALQAAREAIVLLKNDGNLLPLDAKKYQRVALIGPNANATDCMLSNYHGDNQVVSNH
jgi:beta-glucosidase